MKKFNITVSALSMLCLTVFALLVSVFTVVNQRGFYADEFEKCGVEETTGMSAEDLSVAMNVLLDYLEDKRDDISIVVEKNGVKEECFYERETLHMVDVKVLYMRAKAAMFFSLSLTLAGILYAAYRTKFVFSDTVSELKKGMKIAGAVFTAFIAVIGAMVAYDFNWFWVHFHYIFFDNDLWLLDPKYSTMINMLPEELFFAMVVRIIIMFIALMIIPLGILFYRKKKA